MSVMLKRGRNGGPRAGAGRPKGSQSKKTIRRSLEKEEARELLRQIVTAEMEPLIKAQLANAKGIQHFFLRDPRTGQFTRITDPDVIEAALNSGDTNSYWINTKDPNVQAFADLMNRALDKPAEHVTVGGDSKAPLIVKWQS